MACLIVGGGVGASVLSEPYVFMNIECIRSTLYSINLSMKADVSIDFNWMNNL